MNTGFQSKEDSVLRKSAFQFQLQFIFETEEGTVVTARDHINYQPFLTKSDIFQLAKKVSNGYRLLFWGLLVILLDIRIEVLDLLPDFIGYILIVNGLSQLGSFEEIFKKAQPFAILLILLALPGTIGFAEVSVGENMVALGPMIYQLLLTIVHLFMMFYIFDGTHQYAIQLEDMDWANSSKNIWNYYAVVHLIILLSNAFSINFWVGMWQTIIIVSVIIALIIEIVVLVFMKRCKNLCEDVESQILK